LAKIVFDTLGRTQFQKLVVIRSDAAKRFFDAGHSWVNCDVGKTSRYLATLVMVFAADCALDNLLLK